MPFILAHTSGDFMSGRGRTKNKKEAKRFSTRAEAVAYKGNKVVSEEDPDYKKWSVMEVRDSAIDKAIRAVDGSSPKAAQLFNEGRKKITEAMSLYYRAQMQAEEDGADKIVSAAEDMIRRLGSL